MLKKLLLVDDDISDARNKTGLFTLMNSLKEN